MARSPLSAIEFLTEKNEKMTVTTHTVKGKQVESRLLSHSLTQECLEPTLSSISLFFQTFSTILYLRHFYYLIKLVVFNCPL
jgi:hypothetical protein